MASTSTSSTQHPAASLLQMQYYAAHKKVAELPLSKAMRSRTERAPRESLLAHFNDMCNIHTRIEDRCIRLVSETKDPKVAVILSYEFKYEQQKEERVARFTDLFKANAWKEDLQSLREFHQLGDRCIETTSAAKSLIKTLSELEPYEFLCQAYCLLMGPAIGGKTLKKSAQKKYEGKVCSKAMTFERMPTAIMRFNRAFKRHFFDTFSDRKEDDFYSQGLQLFTAAEAMMTEQWCRSQVPLADDEKSQPA